MTPLWVTLLVGVLGPLATIVTVRLTSRANLEKLQGEQAEARRVAGKERAQVLRDRRTEFEIEHLKRLIDAILSLGRRVAEASQTFRASREFAAARLNETLDEELRAAQAEMRVAVELVLEDSIRDTATRLHRDYSAALMSRSQKAMEERLVVVDPVASALMDEAAARIRQLYDDLESETTAA